MVVRDDRIVAIFSPHLGRPSHSDNSQTCSGRSGFVSLKMLGMRHRATVVLRLRHFEQALDNGAALISIRDKFVN